MKKILVALLFGIILLSSASAIRYYANEYINITYTNDIEGMDKNESRVWIVTSDGLGAYRLYEYWINGSNTSFSFDTGDIHSRGVTTNGSWFWISDWNNNLIRQYEINGTLNATFTLSNLPTITDNIFGLANNGTNLFVLGMGNNKYVFDYDINNNMSYTGRSFNVSIGTDVIQPRGLGFDGDYFWVSDIFRDKIYQYKIDGTFISSFTTETSDVRALTTSENYLWIMAYYTPHLLYKYGIYSIESYIFNNPVIETSLEQFFINFLFDNDDYSVTSSSLIYNNSYYTADISTSVNNATATNNLEIPENLGNGIQQREFLWEIGLLNLNTGNPFYFNSTIQYQNITGLIFEICGNVNNISILNLYK